jgi:hypothetical protein
MFKCMNLIYCDLHTLGLVFRARLSIDSIYGGVLEMPLVSSNLHLFVYARIKGGRNGIWAG